MPNPDLPKGLSDAAVEAGSEAIVDLLKRTRNDPRPPSFGEMTRAALTAAAPHLSHSKEHDTDPLAEIGDARVVLWFCPNDHGHRVEWTTDKTGMTPRCIEPGCGRVGTTRRPSTAPTDGIESGHGELVVEAEHWLSLRTQRWLDRNPTTVRLIGQLLDALSATPEPGELERLRLALGRVMEETGTSTLAYHIARDALNGGNDAT